MTGKTSEILALHASIQRLKIEIDAADMRDDGKTRELANIMWRRESWARAEKQRADMERRAREMREEQERQAKRNGEAAEARKRQQEERRLAEQQREAEEARRWQRVAEDFTRQHEELRAHQQRSAFAGLAEEHAHLYGTGICEHGGW